MTIKDYQQEQLLCNVTSNPQEVLSKALQSRNIKAFRKALDLGNPEIEGETLTIFEKCCQTPGHAAFIRECIQWGCDVNKINSNFQKMPINFAAESEDPANIAALLDEPTTNINHPYEQRTPLQMLAANITADNFTNTFDCIKLLVDRQANVNVPDQRDMTAILTIAKSRQIDLDSKELLVTYLLQNACVNLDTFRKAEARQLLQKMFPSISLPAEKSTELSSSYDVAALIRDLKNDREPEFLMGLEAMLTRDGAVPQDWFKERHAGETLLTVAASRGHAAAVARLLREGADANNYEPNHETAGGITFPLAVASIAGNWKVVKLLLQCRGLDVRRVPVLINVVRNMDETGGNHRICDYGKCFDLLLAHEAIDVNQKDAIGNTALHMAVKYNNKSATLALLKRGAYVGAQNKFNDFPINDIDPTVLETHLNNCITTNDRRSGDDAYEIRFNFSNLVPSRCRGGADVKKEYATRTKHSDEMAPVEYMAKSKELKHLVKHPLIASFLFLKWHRLSTVFYANFVCYSIYCLALISYLLFCYGQNAPRPLAACLYTISAVGGLYVLAREVAQLIMSPKVYMTNRENYLELALIGMTVAVLVPHDYAESTRRTVAAITILLAVSEFFLLTGSLPVLSFSTHLVMLKTVSKSFLRGLLLYSIILIAFALCFYTLLGEDDEIMAVKSKNDEPIVFPTAVADGDVAAAAAAEGEDDEFNKFGHPGISIIKTVVMLTGEFDASSINFKHNISSYFIFVIFVFLISTVLFNLLNGLAVSDTQAIKSEAELTHFIYRAELMARYEKILLGKGESECCNFIIRQWSSNLMCLFPEYLPRNMIWVQPNQRNRVLIPVLNDDKQEQPNYDVESGTGANAALIAKTTGRNKCRDLECEIRTLGCCVGNRCSRMESKIVKYAKAVLDRKDSWATNAGAGEIDLHSINARIIKIEHNIDAIFTKIDTVLTKLASTTTSSTTTPVHEFSM